MDMKAICSRFGHTKILLVDDELYMRKVVRTMLMGMGVRTIYEAADGTSGLEMIRGMAPDIVILDWEMPLLNGPELVRIVRSPGAFPVPDIPIIMLSSHGERWRILESVKLGVNEFLCKPVSAKALQERMISILLKPRESVKFKGYYGPAPRVPAVKAKLDSESAGDNTTVEI